MSSPGVIAVIGGGVAGAATAKLLAFAGFEVHLFERSAFPRDKLCGEFLSSEVESLLRRLGCWSEIERAGPAKIERARLTGPKGSELRVALPGSGLGLSRRALDSILLASARQAGVVVRERATVRSITRSAVGHVVEAELHEPGALTQPPAFALRADLVVGAHGRRTRLDRTLDRDFTHQSHPHLGLKQHHRPRSDALGDALVRSLEGTVELHGVDGGYCGLSFVEGGTVNVCALLEERFFRSLPERSPHVVWTELGRRNRALGERLAALEPDGTRPQSVARVPFTTKERSKDGVLFVGDAAGMVAPLAGSGQAMALEGAFLLADLIRERGTPANDAARTALATDWSRRWARKYALRMALGRRLQALLLSGPASDRALRALSRAPLAAEALVRLTRSREGTGASFVSRSGISS